MTGKRLPESWANSGNHFPPDIPPVPALTDGKGLCVHSHSVDAPVFESRSKIGKSRFAILKRTGCDPAHSSASFRKIRVEPRPTVMICRFSDFALGEERRCVSISLQLPPGKIDGGM